MSKNRNSSGADRIEQYEGGSTTSLRTVLAISAILAIVALVSATAL